MDKLLLPNQCIWLIRNVINSIYDHLIDSSRRFDQLFGMRLKFDDEMFAL